MGDEVFGGDWLVPTRCSLPDCHKRTANSAPKRFLDLSRRTQKPAERNVPQTPKQNPAEAGLCG